MSFLFGTPKLNATELQYCLDWLGKLYELTGFQDKEAELYNNALLSDGNSVTTSSTSARKVLKAGNRMIKAAEELLFRHDNMQNIPEEAIAVYYAWGLLFMQWKSLATAQYAGMESLIKGVHPNYDYMQNIMNQISHLEKKANKETSKLSKKMGRSGATFNDIQKLMSSANQTLSQDNWQPPL